MKEQGIDIWKKKLDWIARNGGMALLLAHPDYMRFDDKKPRSDEYPAAYYGEFLEYVKERYEGQYWQALPRDVARFTAHNYRSETRKVSDRVDAATTDVPVRDAVISKATKKRIWIDLDNTPYVPFFYLIIEELRKQNYDVSVTTRDCAQTCGLADLFSLKYKRIGRHYGKSKLFKVAGTVFRGLQLCGIVNGIRPDLAVSHGSRAQCYRLSCWASRHW
jgi:hypothetical protein